MMTPEIRESLESPGINAMSSLLGTPLADGADAVAALCSGSCCAMLRSMVGADRLGRSRAGGIRGVKIENRNPLKSMTVIRLTSA